MSREQELSGGGGVLHQTRPRGVTLCNLTFTTGLLTLGCDASATCPVDAQSKRCLGNDGYCSGSYRTKASCDTNGYCRCHKSVLYDGGTCLRKIVKIVQNNVLIKCFYPAHVSGCQIKQSPSAYVGLPSTDGDTETLYGCVSTATNCDYEVHVKPIQKIKPQPFFIITYTILPQNYTIRQLYHPVHCDSSVIFHTHVACNSSMSTHQKQRKYTYYYYLS